LRRRFVKLVRNTKSPIAEAAVRQIATLYGGADGTWRIASGEAGRATGAFCTDAAAGATEGNHVLLPVLALWRRQALWLTASEFVRSGLGG
jgi:hypothetical protein